MRLQRQKPYECFPTVCAMLLDKPVSQVKRAMLGKALAKESWSYLIANPHTEKHKLLREQVKAYLIVNLPWLPFESFTYLDSEKPFSIPTTGRGAAVINSHIVAFESGLVFDPALPAPIPVGEYREQIRLRNKVVKLIVIQPMEEEKR